LSADWVEPIDSGAQAKEMAQRKLDFSFEVVRLRRHHPGKYGHHFHALAHGPFVPHLIAPLNFMGYCVVCRPDLSVDRLCASVT
jgi:hypothetical protein